MRFGCILVLVGCYSPSAKPGAPCSETGACPSGLVCGPTHVCETPGTVHADASQGGPDAPDMPADAAVVGMDAASPDAQSGPLLVARYTFDNTLADATGSHDGTQIGTGLTYVTGYTNQALQFPSDATGYVRVADSPAFDITSGKLELRFRYGSSVPSGDVGLLSRDANGTDLDGHISIRLGHDRKVIVRIQRMDGQDAYRCTASTVSMNAWHHVEVSFGPAGLVLRVDGTTASGTTWTDGSAATHSCTNGWTAGIAGNNNPLVLGALTIYANEGTGMPVSSIAGDLALDDVAIWADS